jgi:hypothetical protein
MNSHIDDYKDVKHIVEMNLPISFLTPISMVGKLLNNVSITNL